MRNFKYLFILYTIFLSTMGFANDSFEFIVETGGVWQNRNDTKIPPDTGTRFAIDQIDDGPFFHYRVEGFYRFNEKHSFRLLYAPSSIEVTGRTNKPITFNGKVFSGNEDLTIKYKFNSYRFSYLYGFYGFGRDQLNIGLTGKIREAETSFSQPGVKSSFDNVGFVPLIYFEYQKSITKDLSINFSIDAAAAEQGRAFDAALKVRHQFANSSQLGIGIRSLEGGAENEKVFTFSWFNYAFLDFKFNL